MVGNIQQAEAGIPIPEIPFQVSFACADISADTVRWNIGITNLSAGTFDFGFQIIIDTNAGNVFDDGGSVTVGPGETATSFLDTTEGPEVYTGTLIVTNELGQTASSSDTCIILPPPIILVDIDVKPQSCPNPINTNSRGVIPVAILGSDLLDVSEIDVSTIQLEGVSPINHDIEDVASPLLVPTELDENSCTADGPDGFDDLTLKFDAQEVIDALGPVEKGDVISVELEGELFNGITFEGYDIIIIK